MKIISWNCNGKFREKFKFIAQENADIYVIQECENPAKYPNEFGEFYLDYVWRGEKESKGLAIFVKEGVRMSENDWPSYCLRHFLSVNINDEFDLLGVWASYPYVEEYYIYQAINIDKYTEKTILLGDFNSNAMWDKKHKVRNHTAIVNQLQAISLVSAYHYFTNETAGEESEPTFYLHRNKEKPYHIDYCFGNPDKIKNFNILKNRDWLIHSDHLPIQIEVE